MKIEAFLFFIDYTVCMFITVRLLNTFSKELTYAVPKDLCDQIIVGTIVQVPLQRRLEAAMVVLINDPLIVYPFKIRPIDSIFPFPADMTYHKFATQLSALHQINPLYILKRVKNFLTEKEDEEIAIEIPEIALLKQILLTDEQQVAYQAIMHDIEQQKYQVTVLHGVTGSGKTEVYKKLFSSAIAAGKTAILLLPEVSLAIQFEKLLRAQMQQIEIFGFHSATMVKQKRILWQALLHNKPCIIIGVHLPIFLPIENLGIIIVDEEHDSGYQEKSHPKIHSRNAALLKASLLKIPVVLGSATPSISSLWNVQSRSWRLLTLKNRFAGQFPLVQVVALSDKKERKNFWISSQLYSAIQQQLLKKEQTIIFINRRGFSFFVQCTACTFIFSCDNCSVSLTLHEDGQLVCHYCNFTLKAYDFCPDCKGKEFLKCGIGTQQVVAILKRLFPRAIIERADADATIKKKIWQKTVQDFYDQKIDILVGTQSISKGYHFPHVTLVGILWADVNLHFPIYNAAETTLQQLIQVAGRAGRQSNDSKVIVQTMTPHALFNFMNERDYLKFYESEIIKRQMIGYPPAKHIVEIEVRHAMQTIVEQDAQVIVDSLIDMAQEEVIVLGPVPAVIYRVQRTFCQKIFLKSMSRTEMMRLFARINKNDFVSSLFFTIDPVA